MRLAGRDLFGKYYALYYPRRINGNVFILENWRFEVEL